MIRLGLIKGDDFLLLLLFYVEVEWFCTVYEDSRVIINGGLFWNLEFLDFNFTVLHWPEYTASCFYCLAYLARIYCQMYSLCSLFDQNILSEYLCVTEMLELLPITI